MQPDAMFRICSMTKPITSVAVMMLYEEGRFLLDDPISKYLPEFKDPKVLVKPATGAPYSIPATKEITIRDLLRHTSGLTYNWNDDLGPLYEKAGIASGLLQYDGTIGDNVKKLAGIPLLFNPGDRFEYSLSVDVLGRLVEVVSGKPLDEFFRTRIFEPLGMKDTYFYPPDKKLDRLATAYTYYPDKGLNRFPDTPIKEGNFSYSADYPSRSPKKLFSGGAGLVSTAMDYARFCQMMLDGGKVGKHAPVEPQDRRIDDARSTRKDRSRSGLRPGLRSVGREETARRTGIAGRVQLGRLFLHRIHHRSQRADDRDLHGPTASHRRLNFGSRSERSRLSGNQRLRIAGASRQVCHTNGFLRELSGFLCELSGQRLSPQSPLRKQRTQRTAAFMNARRICPSIKLSTGISFLKEAPLTTS